MGLGCGFASVRNDNYSRQAGGKKIDKLINTLFYPGRKALAEFQGFWLDGQNQSLTIIFSPELKKTSQG
jgi:hypothetical protein